MLVPHTARLLHQEAGRVAVTVRARRYAVASPEASGVAVAAGLLAAGRVRRGGADCAAAGLVAAGTAALAGAALAVAERLARFRAGRAGVGCAAAGASEVVEMLSEAAGVPFS
ncbi:hypothetical protein EI293_18360 [Hymenobacter perfusus]|uniref:Uncharacterized protein n=1 Tax=Hymenobacter perfusus TaxID=1236770 RepID=A0A3R9MA37_9BACT|nr:hypothetical protein EI293_18360 [Hymenobacter perfusus]